jgi:hypothetical protein
MLAAPMSRPWRRVRDAQEAKLVAAGDFENESERDGIGITAALSAAGLDVLDAILDAMVHDHALTGDNDVSGASYLARHAIERVVQ